jgi:hypothetical protein
MSNKIYFFTDIDLLQPQTQDQAFGPVVGNETTQYRVTNKFSAPQNETPRAYAVCKGQVLVQQTTDNNFSIILKPLNEYEFKGVPVLYFIYKGITNYTVADTPINKSIVKSDNDVNYSGIGYSSSVEKIENQRFDNESLIALFNKTNYGDYKPINVKSGDVLGEFSASHIELQIVLGSVYYEPHLALARTVGGTAELIDIELVENDIYKRNRKREEILNFMDVAALYGMFIHDGISTKTGTLKISQAYETIFMKFYNRNTIYFDIRDERGFFFNYHRDNTESNIRCCTEYVETYTNTYFDDDTYEICPDWPILILDSTNYNANAENFQIRLSLKTAHKEGVHIYSVHSYWFYKNKKTNERLQSSPKERFQTFSFGVEEERTQPEFTKELIFASPLTELTDTNTKQTIAAYYKILTTDKHNASENNYDYLFPIKPFAEYDYFYDPNLKMQAWLIQHQTFLNANTIVNSGVAIDYEGQRITFFACPIAERYSNSRKTTIGYLPNNHGAYSFYKECFKKRLRNKGLIKLHRQIEPSPYNSNIVDLLKSVSEIDLISISIEKDEFEDKIANSSTLSNFDLYMSPVYIAALQLEERTDAQSSVARDSFYFTSMAIEGYTSNFQKETLLINEFVLYSCDKTLPLIVTTQKAGYIEDIEPNLGVRGFIIDVNTTIDAYQEIIIRDDRTAEEEINAEKQEIEHALKDIQKYNRDFFDTVSEMLYYGVDICYPDGEIRTYFPAIHIQFAKIEGGYGGLFSIKTDSGYEEGANVNPPKYILRPSGGEEPSAVEEYIAMVNQTLNPASAPFDVEWNYERWKPKIVKSEGNIATTLEQARNEGFAVLKPDLTIQLSLQNRCTLQPKDHITITERVINGEKQISHDPTNGYSDRRFFNTKLLIHELGHVYERVTHMLEIYFWGQLEQDLKNAGIDTDKYEFYRNANLDMIKGHILGNQSGTRAVKEEIAFIKAWHQCYDQQLRSKGFTKPLNKSTTLSDLTYIEEKNDREQVLKAIQFMLTYTELTEYFGFKGNITNSEQHIKDYQYNINHLINR